MDLIEKKGETVSFSCIKCYAQNMPECRILHLIFKNLGAKKKWAALPLHTAIVTTPFPFTLEHEKKCREKLEAQH
jgi:hypothetical protein